MATLVKAINNLPKYSKRLEKRLEDALNDMAADFRTSANEVAPKDHGDLRAESYITRPARLVRILKWKMEYAYMQEIGRNGRIIFRNYTTPGTGKHFVRNTARAYSKKVDIYIKRHTKWI